MLIRVNKRLIVLLFHLPLSTILVSCIISKLSNPIHSSWLLLSASISIYNSILRSHGRLRRYILFLIIVCILVKAVGLLNPITRKLLPGYLKWCIILLIALRLEATSALRWIQLHQLVIDGLQVTAWLLLALTLLCVALKLCRNKLLMGGYALTFLGILEAILLGIVE